MYWSIWRTNFCSMWKHCTPLFKINYNCIFLNYQYCLTFQMIQHFNHSATLQWMWILVGAEKCVTSTLMQIKNLLCLSLLLELVRSNGILSWRSKTIKLPFSATRVEAVFGVDFIIYSVHHRFDVNIVFWGFEIQRCFRDFV